MERDFIGYQVVKIVFPVLMIFIVIGCKTYSSASPEPMIELISPYFVVSDSGKVLDISKFNNDCSEWARIIPINNESDNLEFFVIFKHSSDILYYKNGIEYSLVKKE